MLHRLRSWLDRTFAEDGLRGPVLTLLSGSSVVLALSQLAQIVLTRLYTPDEFGVYSYFVTLVMVLPVSVRFEDGLMLPEKHEEAARLLLLSCSLVLVFSGALLLLWPWYPALAAWAEMPALAAWLPWVPLALVLQRYARFGDLWLTRHNAFRAMSTAMVAGRSASLTTQLSGGLPALKTGPAGLIGGFVGGMLVQVLVQVRRIVRGHGAAFRGGLRLRAWGTLARQYRRFPLFTWPATFVATLTQNLPVLLLPLFFQSAEVGFFGLAARAVLVPLSFFGNAIARVFLIRSAEAHREGTLAPLTTLIHRRLVMLGLFPTLALLLAGPDVFAFVFGEDWRTAGLMAQYLSPWFFLAAIASPLTVLFDLLERQHLDLSFTLVMFAGLGTAFWLGGSTGQLLPLLLALGAVGVVLRLAQIGVLLRLGGVSKIEMLKPYVRYALLSVPGLAVLFAATLFQQPWLTTLALVLGGALYLGLLFWRQDLRLTS